MMRLPSAYRALCRQFARGCPHHDPDRDAKPDRIHTLCEHHPHRFFVVATASRRRPGGRRCEMAPWAPPDRRRPRPDRSPPSGLRHDEIDEECADVASNRDRLGRGLELLGEGLAPFVDHYLTAHPAAHTTAAVGRTGRDRGRIHQTRGPMRHGSPTSLGRAYGGVQLRVLTEDWRAFTDALSRVERAFAAELWDVRNRWARNAAVSAEDP